MMQLIGTPEYPDPADPSVIGRWLATESPNNFQLCRRDWEVSTFDASGTYLEVTLASVFTGQVGDDIAVFDETTNSMYVGTVAAITLPAAVVLTLDIFSVAGMLITYLNNNTLRSNYYFEGRLTINGVIQPLTIIASPDSFGYADLDVSGILRITTALGKIGNYSTTIMSETNKSGSFRFEYSECWYGTTKITNPYTMEPNTWYYGECVRSEEQGSNLHDYVIDSLNDAPFLNSFEQPVYFKGLPFDLSFILPQLVTLSPGINLEITISQYDASNTLLYSDLIYVDTDTLEGFINSLWIDPALIDEHAAYLTAEIYVP